MKIVVMLLAMLASPLYAQTALPPNPNPNMGPLRGDPKHMETTRSWWNPFRTELGYVLGALAEVKSAGILIHTLEGSLKLGVTSSRGGYLDRLCYDDEIEDRRPTPQQQSAATQKCTVAVNPWSFSHYNQHLLSRFENLSGQMVLVFYQSFPILPFTRSSNFISKVYFIDPEAMQVGSFYEASSMPFSSRVHYAAGFVEGRIVKATLDGVFRRSYELVIQVGMTGDIFTAISLSDRRLFEFAIRAMATGRYLKISYFQLFGPFAVPSDLLFNYRTNLRASRIDIIEDPTRPTMTTPPP
jgi:hypothetical protein